ncbi:MAG: secretin N-terminal domain-containing protein [Methylococcaceae bacterium]
MVKMSPSTFFTTIALPLLLMSCSSVQKTTTTPALVISAEKSAPIPANPLTTESLAKPEVNYPQSTARYKAEHSLNISVHQIDAREFFMSLAVDSIENMLVHPDVSGLISLELKNVNVPLVLDAVQKVYGYDYKKTEIGYVIYPATLQTKIFKIDRLDLLRQGKSSTYVTSGQTGGTPSGTGGSSSTSTSSPSVGGLLGSQLGGNNQSNTSAGGVGLRASGSSITTTTDTDFWKELDEALHALIAVDKDATVVINRQSGVVIARAKSMQLREIDNFLTTTQNQISRQVILEAKILEVTLNDSHKDGVEWSSIVRKGLLFAPTPLAATNVYTLVANSGSFVAGDFTAVVSLLESQGKTNVLFSPRISTLNNQQAIIKVGEDASFVTGISAAIVSGGLTNTVTQPTPILTPYFSGIALDVTPQINDSGDITLHIHPAITEVTSKDVKYDIGGTLSSTTSTIPTALNVIRETDSIVKAKNGQIIVLGGLMQDRKTENKEGVFGFSRIPYLGSLFRTDTGRNTKTELVILLKATLISNEADWKNDIDTSQQRLKTLDTQPRWQ